MNEFGRIFQNEWVKLLRRKRFQIVLILGIALVAIYTYAQHYRSVEMKHDADPVVQTQLMQERIVRLQSRLNTDTGLTQSDKANINDRIASFNQNIQKLNQPQVDPNVFDSARTQQAIVDLNKQIQSLTPDKEVEYGQQQLQLQVLQYQLDHQLPSIQNAKVTTWSALSDLLNVGSQIFFPLLCVLLAADMVSGEQTGGTIKLLLTRPASRGKILFAKYLTSISASILVVVIILAVLTGLLLALFGTDGAQQPVAVGVHYHSVTELIRGTMTHTVAADTDKVKLTSASSYSINAMLLTLLSTIAMCTLGFFCSVLVRSAAVSTGVAMAVIIIGSIVTNLISGVKWMHYFITANFGLPVAWTGDLSRQFGFPTTLSSSCLILLAWTAALYLAGHSLFTKRDVLG